MRLKMPKNAANVGKNGFLRDKIKDSPPLVSVFGTNHLSQVRFRYRSYQTCKASHKTGKIRRKNKDPRQKISEWQSSIGQKTKNPSPT